MCHQTHSLNIIVGTTGFQQTYQFPSLRLLIICISQDEIKERILYRNLLSAGLSRSVEEEVLPLGSEKESVGEALRFSLLPISLSRMRQNTAAELAFDQHRR